MDLAEIIGQKLMLAFDGMDVPPEIVQRMQDAPKDKRQEEGIKICAEIIQQCREIPGVAGVHIMAIEWEEAVSTVVQMAGIRAG